MKVKISGRQRRHIRIRKRVAGTTERPRLNVSLFRLAVSVQLSSIWKKTSASPFVVRVAGLRLAHLCPRKPRRGRMIVVVAA